MHLFMELFPFISCVQALEDWLYLEKQIKLLTTQNQVELMEEMSFFSENH